MLFLSRSIILAFLLFISQFLNAQSFSINTDGSTADASAILDVKSTNKGMLVPRMTKAQKNSIPVPAQGLLVFQTLPDSAGFHYFDGLAWIYLSTTATDTAAWRINGNANINSSRFLGTLNDSALRFRVRNVASGIIDSARSNTALGYRSLKQAGGTGNSAFGYGALDTNLTGTLNSALGRNALNNNTTGSRNTAIGESSLTSNILGNSNTAIGHNAQVVATSGTFNVAIGSQASALATGTTKVVAVGSDAAFSNQRNNITALGTEALAKNNSTPPLSVSDGANNTAVGFQAMYYNISGSRNTAVGNRALYGIFTNNPTSMRNVGVGDSALAGNFDGAGNVGVGANTLGRINSGNDNVAIGDSAMALAFNTSNNIAIGSRSLKKQRNGYNNNIAIGYEALREDTTGSANLAFGTNALLANTNGSSNTSVGFESLKFNVTGQQNTALGANAGNNPMSLAGSQNTFIGANAFSVGAVVNNLTLLGYGTGSASSMSNTVELGNTSITSIRAQVGSITVYSDSRIKTSVADNVPGLDFIKRLKPVSYHIDLHKLNAFINRDKKLNEYPGMYDIEQKTFNGFLAQDVEQAAREAGVNFVGLDVPADPSKDLYQIRYGDFILPLVKGVQELSKENEMLKKENKEIMERLEKLEKIISRQ